MSNPDEETMRVCRRCGTENSLVASVCGMCGSTLVGKPSGTFPMFLGLVSEVVKKLEADTTANADEERMLREGRALVTFFGACDKRPPSGAERNDAIRRAVALYQEASTYKRP